MTPIVWVILTVSTGVVGFFGGTLWMRVLTQYRIQYLELAAKDARRFSGKLGDRIGRQRVRIHELKTQLKTLSVSTPAMAKPTTRPNLPH